MIYAMRAPTTLGLAGLLLLALGGLYASHVSLSNDPAHAPQGDLLARLRAQEKRAEKAEALAADAIDHARAMRLSRDAAVAGGGRAAPAARPSEADARYDAAAVAAFRRDAPPAALNIEAAIESWLAAPPALPAPPAPPARRAPGPLRHVADGGAPLAKTPAVATAPLAPPPVAKKPAPPRAARVATALESLQALGAAPVKHRATIAGRVAHTPVKPASPYDPPKPYPGSLEMCYEHEGETGRVCVSPELQFKTKSKVHWIPADPSKPGWRFHLLVEDGFARHPAIEPLLTPDGADFVLYLPVSTRTPPAFIEHQKEARQLIVLDEGDGAGFFPRVKESDYLAYFKRSWVAKRDGAYTGQGRRYSRHYYPLAYSIADSYFDAAKMGKVLRSIDILCSNRPHERQPTRSRIVSWIHSYLEKNPSTKGIAGDVNSGGRREINTVYFDSMRRAKIVVTCNPSHWEGDFRLMEALASGALIFVDEMYTPHPRPFVDGEHIIVYDNSDPEAFAAKLDYYLAHPEEASKIAAAGLRHALKCHRAVSRLDWILRSAHEIRAEESSYTHTARQIKYDLKSTTQVEPFVDIGGAFKDVKSVSPVANVGRRKKPPALSKADIALLVQNNKAHRKSLGFKRR